MTRTQPVAATPASAARRRDLSGRVLDPVKIEVKFGHGGGYRHYCASFAEAAGFLASPAFKQTAHIAKSVTITMTDPDPGPVIDPGQKA